MANPPQQFSFNPRPQYPTAAGGMNLGMNMGAMGMNLMGGPGMAPQNAMMNPALNQYQIQMRAHAGNGLAQQQSQTQGMQGAPSPAQGYGGMSMQGGQQQQGNPMAMSMQNAGFGMSGMQNPMMSPMKQPQSFPHQQPQGYPQHPQYPMAQQGQFGASPHQPQYPGSQQAAYGVPQQQYPNTQAGLSYPQQHTPSTPSHPGGPPTPSLQHLQHQSSPMYPQQPGMNVPQYPPQNGMIPGRPSSSMGGIHAPTPTMPGATGMQPIHPGMKTPQTPSVSGTPGPGSMNPPSHPQTPMMSMGVNGMPGQTQGLTPQQVLQMHQARQQVHSQPTQQGMAQQQQASQGQPGQMMDMQSMMMHHPQPQPPQVNLGMGQHPSQPTAIQVQVPPANPTPQPTSAGPTSATRSSSVGRTPTPTLPGQTPQQSMPQQAGTPVSSVPSSAGGPMANRPPSAAGGMMHPHTNVPSKMGYPGGQVPNGLNMGGVSMPASAPASTLNQLQMLGNQVGVGGVSTVGPGMFNTPVPPSSAGLSHGAAPPGLHANGPNMHAPQPGMSSQFNPALAASINIRTNPGMGAAPMPSMGQRPHGGTPSLSMANAGAGMAAQSPSAMPLTAGMGSNSLISSTTPASLAAAAAAHRSGRSPRPPGATPAPRTQQNLAERTMSPRQRQALVPMMARVTSVPADDEKNPLEESLPDLKEEEIDQIADWIKMDRAYEGEYRKMKEGMTKELRDNLEPHLVLPEMPKSQLQQIQDHPRAVGRPIRWFEKDWKEESRAHRASYSLIWPHKRAQEKENFYKRLGRKPVTLSKKVDPVLVEQVEMLVPIRLDVDIGDGWNRLRDTFVWNANDPYVTPQVFAQSICDDFAIGFGLGQSSESARRKFLDQVINSINEQITDFKGHRVEIENRAPAPRPLPHPTGKPVSTVGGTLTVNGLGREKSRSRSVTPLPGERERSEKPLSALRKVPSAVSLAGNDTVVSKKRSRPIYDAPDGPGRIEDDEKEWWERWRKRMRVLDGSGVRRNAKGQKVTSYKKPVSTFGGRKGRSTKPKFSSSANGIPTNGIKVEIDDADSRNALVKIEEPDEYERELLFVDEDEPELPPGVNEDLRIVIKLDISFGIRRLEDQFEWDISDKYNSAEQFAEVYCRDLGLSGEFKTAIAHSIREQVQVYEKSLFLVGHPMDGTTIQDEDLRLAFLPSLNSCIRPIDQVATYTPQLMFFNEADLEKTFDRGGPRKRRQPRGRRAGAVPLPDREPVRTFRTPMIGFPEVEKEKDPWVAPSRRQAAMVAERANAQIAVIESAEEIRAQPAFGMGSMGPGSMQTLQQQRNAPSSNAIAGPSQSKSAPEPQKKNRADLLRGPPVAKRVLRSRNAPKSTAVNPEAPIPEYLRGYDKAKGGEKKKSMYKDRELPEGLHPNMIDGVWHCSSCGVPEDIAVGRRQGPLGPKTMCGDCGKWWHRHRKPMDIIYRTDREYHVERKKKEEEYRRQKKRGGMKAAQAAAAAIVDGRAAQRNQAPASSASTSQSHAPPLFTTVPRPINNRTQPPPRPLVMNSPESSLSPPPFTPQQVKVPVPKLSETHSDRPPPASEPSPTQSSEAEEERPPQWLIGACAELRSKEPQVLFEIVPRPQPAGTNNPIEWRVKCLDCPGKLYNPGPEPTMENFRVHLRNRQHRIKLHERLGIPFPSAPSETPAIASTENANPPVPQPSSEPIHEAPTSPQSTMGHASAMSIDKVETPPAQDLMLPSELPAVPAAEIVLPADPSPVVEMAEASEDPITSENAENLTAAPPVENPMIITPDPEVALPFADAPIPSPVPVKVSEPEPELELEVPPPTPPSSDPIPEVQAIEVIEEALPSLPPLPPVETLTENEPIRDAIQEDTQPSMETAEPAAPVASTAPVVASTESETAMEVVEPDKAPAS